MLFSSMGAPCHSPADAASSPLFVTFVTLFLTTTMEQAVT